MTRTELSPLTPLQQLRAGRLPRRLTQLYVGLTLYGVSMAMMIRSELGLPPWDVFHYGIARHVEASFGTIVIVVGVGVLLLWVPLRQWPGLGTISNVVVIGVVSDVGLHLLAAPDPLWARILLLVGGVLANGVAGALYIGSQFGAGPRDGLMTGVAARWPVSLRLVRTAIEVAVLATGWLLGGVVGLGTVLYAVAIGPVVQAILPWVAVPLAPVEASPQEARGAATEPVTG